MVVAVVVVVVVVAVVDVVVEDVEPGVATRLVAAFKAADILDPPEDDEEEDESEETELDLPAFDVMVTAGLSPPAPPLSARSRSERLPRS